VGNVNTYTLIYHLQVVEERSSTLTEELNRSMKGIFAVHKVFTALQVMRAS
jgi:hypothetical protein